MTDYNNSNRLLVFGIFLSIVVGAWLTHIFTCFANEMWGFLIAGAVFFPVGILHGFYIWFS